MHDLVIEVDQVSKSYGSARVVDDVSLSVARGEFVGLLGPNGAGKTTLIEMIEGLREPDSGTVTVLGHRPHPRNLELLPRMGVQTQKSAFFDHLTAIEHLETVAGLYGRSPADARRSLEQVGLADAADVRVTRVSGGQRQRLAIAAALVHEPEVIFLDEPTGPLDPQARRDLWSMLRRLKGEGRSIVYTTHHLDEAEALCDRVAILHAGRIAALDSPRTLISGAALGSEIRLPAGRMTAVEAGALDGVDSVSDAGADLVLHTQHVARVLAALGPDLDAVTTRGATLEDVYLDLIGARS